MIVTEYMENGALDTYLKVGVLFFVNKQKRYSQAVSDKQVGCILSTVSFLKSADCLCCLPCSLARSLFVIL